MIGPDANSYIFCSETAFGPEKIIPPRVLTPNLVRIDDRTFPPIIGGPKTSRAIAAGHSASVSVKGFVAEVPPRSELRAHSCGDGYV